MEKDEEISLVEIQCTYSLYLAILAVFIAILTRMCFPFCRLLFVAYIEDIPTSSLYMFVQSLWQESAFHSTTVCSGTECIQMVAWPIRTLASGPGHLTWELSGVGWRIRRALENCNQNNKYQKDRNWLDDGYLRAKQLNFIYFKENVRKHILNDQIYFEKVFIYFFCCLELQSFIRHVALLGS